jgi:hypothetical protein
MTRCQKIGPIRGIGAQQMSPAESRTSINLLDEKFPDSRMLHNITIEDG